MAEKGVSVCLSDLVNPWLGADETAASQGHCLNQISFSASCVVISLSPLLPMTMAGLI